MRTGQTSGAPTNAIESRDWIQPEFTPLLHWNQSQLAPFIQFVSHDLKVPLRFMKRIAERMIDLHEDSLPGEVIDGIVAIQSSADQMSKLIENLLIFLQLDSSGVEKQQLDLHKLARQVFDELQAEIGDREIEMRIDELPAAYGDRALLKQAFANLLSNAIKFTRPREKATIQVGAIERDDVVIYFIRDNGIGFDPEQSEALFLPFQKLNNANGVEGSGIGMTLVKRIIEQHHGRIWAEGSRDQGATFYFVLGE